MESGIESILPVGPAHLQTIREIARESFPVLWAPKEFLYFLEHPLGLNLGIFTGDTLQTYFLSLLVRGELDIVSVASRPECRKQGKAERLLRYVQKLPTVDKAFLEVEASNLPAQKLYEKIGFSVTGVRKKYYQHRHDAHLMKWQRE